MPIDNSNNDYTNAINNGFLFANEWTTYPLMKCGGTVGKTVGVGLTVVNNSVVGVTKYNNPNDDQTKNLVKLITQLTTAEVVSYVLAGAFIEAEVPLVVAVGVGYVIGWAASEVVGAAWEPVGYILFRVNEAMAPLRIAPGDIRSQVCEAYFKNNPPEPCWIDPVFTKEFWAQPAMMS
jgi:hypothetical protein